MASDNAKTLNQALHTLRISLRTKHEDEALAQLREVTARIRVEQGRR